MAESMYKDITRKHKAKLNPTIVAYGDSNTRYHEGDRGLNGSISNAYSSWIDRYCADYPTFMNSTVINAGYSGQTIEYALKNYITNIKNNAADIVIIGFGTNNIRVNSNTMESYIVSMTIMIDNLLNDGILPIILGIPWYSSNYSPGTETRIPIWNEALSNLCVDKNIEFIDVYNMFLGEYASTWFNEVTTAKRHYSKIAQKTLAEEIFNRILKQSYLQY